MGLWTIDQTAEPRVTANKIRYIVPIRGIPWTYLDARGVKDPSDGGRLLSQQYSTSVPLRGSTGLTTGQVSRFRSAVEKLGKASRTSRFRSKQPTIWSRCWVSIGQSFG